MYRGMVYVTWMANGCIKQFAFLAPKEVSTTVTDVLCQEQPTSLQILPAISRASYFPSNIRNQSGQMRETLPRIHEELITDLILSREQYMHMI